MGDRANVIVQEGNERVFLYVHWKGYDLARLLQKGLQLRWRWDDPSYLTRILYDAIVEGDEGKETGYGIWSAECDNNRPFLLVDVEEQIVYILRNWADKNSGKCFSFEQYCKLDKHSLATAYKEDD